MTRGVKPAPVAIALAVVASLVVPAGLSPRAAAADELHGDLATGVVVPLAGARYREAVTFGGRLAARAYLGPLAAQLELAGFADAHAPIERLTYRGRAMAGARWRNRIDGQRGLAVRGLAGVELGAFDQVGTSSRAPEVTHLGFAAEGAIESHSELPWAEVSIGIAVILTVQPFGEEGGGDYVGLEGVLQLALGF